MRGLVFVALLGLAGCVDVVQHAQVATLAVVTKGCQGEDRVAGADTWRLRVLQDNALTVEETGSIAADWPRLAVVPESGAVKVRLEAWAGEPGVGRLVAWGHSRTVPNGAPRDGVTLAVTLVPPDAFSEVCVKLARARAGHTATVLGDGRVLVAGGVEAEGEPPLASVEMLEPFAPTGAEVGSLGLTVSGSRVLLPRAHHAAVRLTPAQVLLWGGLQQGNGAASSLSTALVYDADLNDCGAIPSPSYGAHPRAFHALAAFRGDFYAFGGSELRGDAGTPVPMVERLDDETIRLSEAGPIASTREEAALAASTASGDALSAGGLADGGVSADVEVVHLGPTLVSRWTGTLATPRRLASAVAAESDFLVAGGVDGQGAALGTTEWVRFAAPYSVEPGPAIAPRASPCIVAVGGDFILIIGGVVGGQPSAAAELVRGNNSVQTVTFPGPPRYGHACTVLDDGSVLVTGGYTTGGVALDDAWLYRWSVR